MLLMLYVERGVFENATCLRLYSGLKEIFTFRSHTIPHHTMLISWDYDVAVLIIAFC